MQIKAHSLKKALNNVERIQSTSFAGTHRVPTVLSFELNSLSADDSGKLNVSNTIRIELIEVESVVFIQFIFQRSFQKLKLLGHGETCRNDV